MPKKVDHEQRKIRIAEATWKVIVRDGLENASVRKIAKEAGLSVGSLRHFFASQSELMLFSMGLVSDRVKKRIEAKQYDGEPMEKFTDIICELIPLDQERKIEMEVWFVFSARALIDHKLETLSRNVHLEMHDGFYKLIKALDSLKLLKNDVDIDIETLRLHALVDGIAMHHLMQPELLTYNQVIDLVRYHLKQLCVS